ncbi:phosphatidate cytidylyltransferase [Oceanicaulis sp. MMSF_3324]|uniref:phosphatidate cytidylyltransferase n=1 Tax=Oceanicaulis sp. MMSF_3324 TaxID=3046702 RepID=UPI00274014C0|nr:phosphatidate cytidylyltransferase [Oceanicaulis sp. MMSF_3324]
MAEQPSPDDLPGPDRARRGDPMFSRRVLSALVLAPVAVGMILWGGIAFSIFIAAFAAAMAWEWVRMSDPDAPPRAFAIATGAAVGGVLLASQLELAGAAIWIAGGALAAFADRWPRDRAFEALFGVAYVALAASVLAVLRIDEMTGLAGIIFLISVVWAADTFAYLAGSWLGGWKLLPAASPNKTWSGLVAGLAFGVIAGAFAAWWAGWDPRHGALLAAPTALAAVAGDLLMSLAKRRFGVKDAGTVIPGHGGVLDRVDALMMAALFAGAWAFMGPGGWPGGSA